MLAELKTIIEVLFTLNQKKEMYKTPRCVMDGLMKQSVLSHLTCWIKIMINAKSLNMIGNLAIHIY